MTALWACRPLVNIRFTASCGIGTLTICTDPVDETLESNQGHLAIFGGFIEGVVEGEDVRALPGLR